MDLLLNHLYRLQHLLVHKLVLWTNKRFHKLVILIQHLLVLFRVESLSTGYMFLPKTFTDRNTEYTKTLTHKDCRIILWGNKKKERDIICICIYLYSFCFYCYIFFIFCSLRDLLPIHLDQMSWYLRERFLKKVQGTILQHI